MNHNK